jgi:membrane protease YdiL (CAAX protease family)
MDILAILLLFAPLVLILWLANQADLKRGSGEAEPARAFAWITYGLLFLLYAALFVFGLVFLAIDLVQRGPLGAQLGDIYTASGLGSISWSRAALGLCLPSLLGVVLLIPAVRRLIARGIPIDSTRVVHSVALSYSALVVANLLLTLAIGLSNLADMMESGQAAGASYNVTALIWAQDLALVFMALVGVGWLSRRALRATLDRLGIVAPTWAQIGIGLGAALAMVPVVLLVERFASQIGLPTNPDVQRLTEQMLGPMLTSLPGVLTLGLAAALGEESVFRGALQPRFGLIVTAALFALLHSNYGISLSTVLVFGVGIVLGLLRLRYNTTVSMVTHAIYNISLGLITYLGLLKGF